MEVTKLPIKKSSLMNSIDFEMMGYRRNKRHSDFPGSAGYGDKGFIGQDWQQQIAGSTGNRIWTIHRQNQHHQSSSNLRRLISRVRQRIEGVFHEIQNTGRNPERLLNKTVQGLAIHMAAKIASHTLRLFLRDRFSMNVLTFEFVAPS